MATASNFFTRDQKKAIGEAIRQAELHTSGEIRVHIELACPKAKSAVERATEVFGKLKMNRTAARNGVLFYLAIRDRQFAVWGDAGIHAAVQQAFWDQLSQKIASDFSQQRFTEGLCEAIRLTGEELKSHFPRQSDDKNELSNEVSFS